MEDFNKCMEDITTQFSELTISDGSSGTIRKKNKVPAPVGFPEFTHYALALPEDHARGEGVFVFDSLKQALASLKHNKGARLKGFPSREEAVQFAATPVSTTAKTSSAKDTSPQGGSSSVTPQLLVQLRKHIERGETESFLQKVFQNPKVLVGKSDNPSILQEGTHVNALHIAAKCDNSIVCQLVLNILENQCVLKRIFPHENLRAIEKRKMQLLDLYLNTPEKCLGETPLHYAAKFGSVGCVKILLNHPLCIPDRKNVHGKTAEDITGTRMKIFDSVKADEIVAAFQDLYYVTILRTDDLLSPPVVSKPSLKKDIALEREEKSALDSCLKIRAFAGPMSEEKAQIFYQHLRNPSLATSHLETKDLKLLYEIRKSDTIKGLERIARQLAQDLDTQYMEYYSFLNAFANVAKEEGLQVLEQFFKTGSVHPDKQLTDSIGPEDLLELVNLKPHAHVNALGHDINVYLRKEYILPPEETYFTPPSSPELENEFVLAPESSPEDILSKSSDKDLFIEGSEMTRLDVDVLLAMQDVNVDPETFPSIHKWRSRVESKLNEYQDDGVKMKALTPLASVSVPRLPKRRDKLYDLDRAVRKLFPEIEGTF